MILSWPPNEGRSLGVHALNFLADPTNSLATLPEQLPPGLDDNGDAVAEHDAQEAEYYREYQSSRLTRLRLKLKVVSDPFDPSTGHQILVGLGVLSLLLIWRLNQKQTSG